MQGRKKVVVDWTGGVRVRRSSERDWAGMDGWMDGWIAGPPLELQLQVQVQVRCASPCLPDLINIHGSIHP